MFQALNDDVITEFGEPVTIRRSGLADLSLRAIFDRRPALTDQGGTALSSDFEISVSLREADLSGRVIEPGADVVGARGRDFAIFAVQPDGQGMARIILQD